MDTAAPAEWVDVTTLIPWEDNPYDHPPEQVDDIARSITANGWGDVIVAHLPTRRIVSGHGRRLAALQLIEADAGWRLPDAPSAGAVPVRWVRGEWEDVCEALAIAANETARNADRRESKLAEVLERLRARREAGQVVEHGVRDAEVRRLLAARREALVKPEGDDGPPPVDTSKPPDSVIGTVYELGPHRLLCGDSTSAESYSALMSGTLADIVWTDPPYGVEIVGGSHALSPKERLRRGGLTIENDALTPDELETFLRTALSLAADATRPGGAWYVAAPPGPLHHRFATVLLELDIWRWTLQWVKDRFVLGRADYHHRNEPIFYGWKPGAPHYFVDDRTQDNILEFARPARNAEHPTMKPVPLIERCLRNSAKPGWVVLEPFGGSGSTLIAAAQCNMTARLIELSPVYCDVIRRRWTRWAIANGEDPGPGALHD